MTTRLILRGLLTGTILTVLLAVFDGVRHRGYMFGLVTGLFGVATGGVMLMVAFLMAMASYMLAQRNRAPLLRKQLLAGAIFAGAAGMSFGFSSAALWILAGRPWFP